ncbi:TetR/AcrR family transcriptional regulator [Nocardioides carbamazepini]|uniref:TetR/AcrR family transcriptional regulator n=1 Tax=Nocardioides carbamazepini TaxID=2854259 RepID=UPI00214A1EB8|nr:TetR/AcrR family transcriptional regulator [Nocardioides carbamazepini]MCR1784912.1 TetR/AcrR family transcriptional regulator [Nocardioides carbamazepini]
MSGSATTPRKRPKDRKAQILVNARDLFVEQGYANVSMAMIAESVDITAGALYRHFANKAVLLASVFDDSFHYLDAPPRGETFAELVDDAVGKVRDRRYVAELWSREVRHLPAESQAALRSRMRKWARAFLPALRDLRPDLDDGQLDLLAWALQSLLSGLASAVVSVSPDVRAGVVSQAMRLVAETDLVPTGEPRSPGRRRLAPQSMRERLLLAAIDQFSRFGYADTSLASIGAAVDVTGQNLYGYFASKADLWQAVVDRGVHAAWLGLDEALAVAATPEDALAGALRSHLRLEHPWIDVRLPQHFEDDSRDRLRAGQREYLEEWIALLGRIHSASDPRLARLKVLLVFTLLSDLSATPHLVSRSSFEDNACRMALHILLSHD